MGHRIDLTGGSLGQSALALGISPGVVQNLVLSNSLEVFVQGKIAERNIMAAQARLEQTFKEQRQSFLELQQRTIEPSKPLLFPVADESISPILLRGRRVFSAFTDSAPTSFCPIFGTDETI